MHPSGHAGHKRSGALNLQHTMTSPDMTSPDLSDLVHPGTLLYCRVTPRAARNRIERDGARLRVYVTTVPEGGKANAQVVKLLSKALGVPKSRLVLVQGATSRDKRFRIDP